MEMPRRKRLRIYLFLALAVLLLVGAALTLARLTIMGNRLAAGYESIEPVDVAALRDGTYRGEFRDFLVRVDVAVEIAGGSIREVRILEQDSGPGYEAAEIPGRIVEAQSPRVDVVSGATGSSKAIMTAVYRAITGRQ
ncbi:MAG: FMN-binding protein [Spirochaetaceae bacterium]|nr:MAG: FMN-binding protein [Spirochaetaceae bacterium]